MSRSFWEVLIVLGQDPCRLLDVGIAEIVFLLPQPERHDEAASWPVVADETQLEPLELPEIVPSLAQTLEMFPARDVAGFSQAFEQRKNLLPLLAGELMVELERR